MNQKSPHIISMWVATCIWLLCFVSANGHTWKSKENTTFENGLDVFKQGCMGCICAVEGCEKNIGKCKMDKGSLSCGPFQIKVQYWIDCGKPGTDWKSCTKQMACSQKCVISYMSHYGRHCTGGREPTCKDYARMQNGGPTGCRPQTPKKEKNLIIYWGKVYVCCKIKGNC